MKPLTSSSSSGLRFLLLALAYVPAIVFAPNPNSLPPKTCIQAEAKISGISGITGSAFFITTGPDFRVLVTVNVKGLQAREDDLFHIHTNAVSGNSCESTGGHFNPTGALFPCPNPTNQTTCQVGDLSGKGGPLKAQGGGKPVAVEYHDKVIRLPSIVGKSIVIHDRALFRIACGETS
ncbi:hypothetical protein VP01_4200g1 [Puccinia sorghi]|uniref:Superoxide dismutase copper/zinc binding domain-containing protein n=1 Tax=Puccinia sorghi TaxID=27349 RepID=A0A0L6UQR5_9BASI|nr:hypothetical protein VP01_4200g1 [Puccinia sorghi]